MLLRAIGEGKPDAPEQILARWTWRLARGDPQGAGPQGRPPSTRRRSACSARSPTPAATATRRTRPKLVRAALRAAAAVGAALLASAEGYTPRATKLIDEARERLGAIDEVALALAENLPAPKQQASRNRRRRRRKKKTGATDQRRTRREEPPTAEGARLERRERDRDAAGRGGRRQRRRCTADADGAAKPKRPRRRRRKPAGENGAAPAGEAETAAGQPQTTRARPRVWTRPSGPLGRGPVGPGVVALVLLVALAQEAGQLRGERVAGRQVVGRLDQVDARARAPRRTPPSPRRRRPPR